MLSMVLQKAYHYNCHYYCCYPYYHSIFLRISTSISSVSSGNWSLVNGNGKPLPSISDGYNYTCHNLELEGGSMLLKSEIGVPFKAFQVTVLITGGEVVFFPNLLSQCKKPTSLLMTHDSSQEKLLGQTCKPFCEVPGSCRFEEMIALSMDERDYVFTCDCAQPSCNELFVWFQLGAVHGRVSICEVQVVYP